MEKNELQTQINSVIVYQTGVQITQIGSIDLKNGEQIITITNLPDSLDKESIRVKGVGNGKIININIEFNSKKEYKKEEHKTLQEEKERIEKEIKRKEIELTRILEQIQKFKSTENSFYSDWAKAYAFGEVGLTNFLEFNDKINDYIKSKVEKIDSLEDKIKELREELQVVQNKIYKLGPIEKVTNYYEVSINLNVKKEGEFKIEIRYTMTEAWWIPFYDISLNEGNTAKLTMMANVYNRTGQDWENSDVEISTASLKPISLVRPRPMILQEYVPYSYGKGKSGFVGGGKRDSTTAIPMSMPAEKSLDMLADTPDVDTAWKKPEPEIEESYAEVSENIGVQSFKIPNKINIPSDKNPHPVNLTIQELKTEKRYYWSCIAPENVIIQDRLINNDLLLLSGNVKIYYLEEFLGETSIPLIAPKEEFKLGTRVSYDLKIEKKIIDRSKGKKAIKGKLKNNYEYKIMIKNLNKATEELVILDRIPHSSSENIKVEIESILPEPDKKELGILKWKLMTKDIVEKTINYKYYVEYKKGITITPSLP